MSQVVELFGVSTTRRRKDWKKIAHKQCCPYLNKTCIKIRKSQPEISIGTCSVLYGRAERPIVICPYRLLERRQVFTDCLHLLSTHEPGNELHIVPEVSVPGGSVDYFLVSAREGKVKDFVGMELQTLDTTGTVWPARQQFLESVKAIKSVDSIGKTFGMNWKMTAKTILIQLHHKIQTFEALNRRLVLVIQDSLLDYLRKQFNFSHVKNVRHGDPMQIHSYQMARQSNDRYKLELAERISTDAGGVAKCLGLQAETKSSSRNIVEQRESKLSEQTRFQL